jgi:predicted Zn-dependent protease
MRRKCLVLFLSLVIAAPLCHAQLGFGKSKDKPQAQHTDSNGQPQYSDADKARMAEIAQRPDTQAAIEAAWNVRRNDDLEEAYRINQTADWAISDNPMVSKDYDPREKRLYNNPMMQLYINQIGQRLVPKDSPNLYTFRIILRPIPAAYSLTTGSVYITTGLLSMLDSEAQLGYILAHEIAHVEQRHEYNRTRNEVLEAELNKEKEAKAERTKALIDVGAALGGGLIGGLAKGSAGAIAGAALGLGGGLIGSSFIHSGVHETDWSVQEENEADALGAKYMLSQGYDAREIPRLYASLDRMVSKDSRVGMGFLGNPKRVKERSGHIQELLNGPLHEQLLQLAKTNGLVGSGTSFPILLAAAKRDNAIVALQYDLFAMAQANLEDALVQRSNDPSVHFYLSRVMSMTAHTPEDRHQAVTHIQDAIRLDAARGAIPDLHLELAISLLTQGNSADKDQVVNELKSYVALYQRDNRGAVPNNMPAIIDYFNLVGETGWYLPPGWYPNTQMMNTASTTTIAPAAVVQKALVSGGGDSAPAPIPAATSAPPTAHVRQTSAKK